MKRFAEKEFAMRIDGIEESMRALARLDQKARRRVASKAVRAGAKIQRNTAKSYAPVDRGWLKKQMRTSVKRNQRKGTVTGTLKVKRTKAQGRKGIKTRWQVVHLIVAGTKPHIIPGPSRLGANTWVSNVQHPGARPNPFMDRAARSSAHAAIQEFRKVFGQAIEAEARKGHP